MRKYVESGSGIAVVLVLALFLAVNVSATSFDISNEDDETILNPGERVNAFSFDVIYGGDENLTGTADPGTPVKTFVDDETMFVNQSADDKAVNGYSDGEDIVNVSLAYSQGTPADFNSTKIGLFGSDVYFLDGAVDNNSVFDGENMVSGQGEAVVRTSSGLLDDNADVIVQIGRAHV